VAEDDGSSKSEEAKNEHPSKALPDSREADLQNEAD